MPKISNLDSFLEISTSLLEVCPDEARVSLKYHTKPPSKAPSKSLEFHSFTSFKTYNPRSGVCYVFKTNKAKEVSRILTALGPRGVQFTKIKKVEQEKKKSEEKYVVDGRGFASLMSNVEFKIQEEPAEVVKIVEKKKEAQTTQTPKKKKKGKKGKK